MAARKLRTTRSWNSEVGDDLRAIGLAVFVVQEHQLDIGGEAQLAPAALAEGQDGHLRDFAISAARMSVQAAQVFGAQVVGVVDDHFGQVGQFGGEIPKFAGVAEQVAHVEPEHLAVFEIVEHFAPGGIFTRRLRPRHGPA
jgi:hypothetical protein